MCRVHGFLAHVLRKKTPKSAFSLLSMETIGENDPFSLLAAKCKKMHIRQHHMKMDCDVQLVITVKLEFTTES